MKVYLAQPRGFCAGVVRAIEIVERALEKYGPPVYVRHGSSTQIRGRKPENKAQSSSRICRRAAARRHRLQRPRRARSVEEEAAARGLPVLNATCPLVTKVHNQASATCRRPGADPDRSCRAPRGRGNHGQVPGPRAAGPGFDDVAA